MPRTPKHDYSYAALEFISSGGTPVKGIASGGKITAIRMEHVWVEAYIDYIPSRGARHKTGQGDTWIRLDASYKQYGYSQPMDIKSAVSFDSQAFIDQIRSTATINETEGYVTNLNSLFIQQTMDDYRTRVDNYLAQNHPNATVGDVLGKKEIVKQEFPYLLGTLPYRDIVAGRKVPEIPDTLRHKITFKVFKDLYDSNFGTPINVTKSLPEIAGKKITLSYAPATTHDEAVIDSFLPKPHADGTPIQISELPSSLPAYLINVKPELKMDGMTIATGTPVSLGSRETFVLTFSGPNTQPDVVMNDIEAGQYSAIAVAPGKIAGEHMLALKSRLDSTAAKIQAQDTSSLNRDDLIGDMLFAAALTYFAELDLMQTLQSRVSRVVWNWLPSESIFSFTIQSTTLFGVPLSVSTKGLTMDVDRCMGIVKAADADRGREVQFMLQFGMNSSALEHAVPEQLFSPPGYTAQGISAVKALQIASERGIPIYKIDSANISSIMPKLQVAENVREDIINAVSAGKVVTIAKTNIVFNGWSGSGYMIHNPMTGAGSYMISSGHDGSAYDGLQNSVWSVFDSICLLVDAKGVVLEKCIKHTPNLANKLGKVNGVFNIVLAVMNVLYEASNVFKSTDDKVKIALSIAVLAITTILSVGGSLLIAAAAGTGSFVILCSVAYITLLSTTLNFLKAILLELILMALMPYRRSLHAEVTRHGRMLQIL